MMLRGDGQKRPLRNVTVLRQMHDNATAADARRDAIDQCRQFVIVMNMGVEIALRFNDTIGTARRQAHQVETESEIERIRQCVEPLAKQALDHRHSGNRLPGFHRNGANRAIGTEEAGVELPRALAMPLHGRDQCLRQAGQRGGDDRIGRHRFGETLLHHVIRGQLARRDRRIALPQCLLKQCREPRAEPRSDLVPFARGDIADGLQSGAAQPTDDRLIDTEREHRQRLHRCRLLALTDNAARDMARQRPRADRRTGNRSADGKTLPRQCTADRLQHRSLAAEQMRATADVEKQAMRRIERHQRREAIAPVGNVVQRPAVGRLVGIEHLHVRDDGARIGERQADIEAEARRCIVQCKNLQRIVLLGDDDAGPVGSV